MEPSYKGVLADMRAQVTKDSIESLMERIDDDFSDIGRELAELQAAYPLTTAAIFEHIPLLCPATPNSRMIIMRFRPHAKHGLEMRIFLGSHGKELEALLANPTDIPLALASLVPQKFDYEERRAEFKRTILEKEMQKDLQPA